MDDKELKTQSTYFTKRNMAIVTRMLAVLAIVLGTIMLIHPEPKKASITIKSSLEPVNSSDYKLIADVYPVDSVASVNGKTIKISKQGQLEMNMPLVYGDNGISVVTVSGNVATHKSVIVRRNNVEQNASNANNGSPSPMAVSPLASSKKERQEFR